MVDVMVKPDFAIRAEQAAKRAVVAKYYYYHDCERKAAAREVLRHVLQYPDAALKEDGAADMQLEAIWNALVNN